jgi:hypothetical protein
LLERHDDPAHRTPTQGIVSGYGCREWLSGEDTRQHPDRATGIASVQQTGRALEPTQAASLDLDVEAFARTLATLTYSHTKPAKAPKR